MANVPVAPAKTTVGLGQFYQRRDWFRARKKQSPGRFFAGMYGLKENPQRVPSPYRNRVTRELQFTSRP